MSPFKLESRVAIVIESVDCPALCGDVTSLTVLFPVLPELSAVRVGMTRIAGDRGASIDTSRSQWSVGCVARRLPMTVRALGLLVGSCQCIAGLAGVIVGPEVERGGILLVTSRAIAFGHLSLELLAMGVCVALLAFTGRRSKQSDRQSLGQSVATDAGNRCMGARKWIDCCVCRDVVPCRDKSFLTMTVGALRVAGEELPLVRVHVAGVTLVRRGSESAHPCVRVGRMALDACHAGMGAFQRIGIRMASDVELSGLELCGGVTVRTIWIPLAELSAMRVRMTTLAHLRLPCIAGGFRIRISLVVTQPGRMAFLAGYFRVRFIEGKARQSVGLWLDAADAFRPRFIGSQVTGCTIVRPLCAVRRLMTVRTGCSFRFVESHPHVIDILDLGFPSVGRDRRRVAVRTPDASVGTFKHIVIVMPEPDRRSKRLLAVATLTVTSQSSGMNIFVAADAILRQSQESGMTWL